MIMDQKSTVNCFPGLTTASCGFIIQSANIALTIWLAPKAISITPRSRITKFEISFCRAVFTSAILMKKSNVDNLNDG